MDPKAENKSPLPPPGNSEPQPQFSEAAYRAMVKVLLATAQSLKTEEQHE